MKPMLTRFTACLLAITLSACSATHVVTRWRDPATSKIVFTKIVAVAIGANESLMRRAEEDLCSQVKKVPCKPSYLAMPDFMRKDPAAAKELVRKGGFDGALVMRVVSDREKVSYAAPTYGPSFWGYHSYVRGYDPGHYRSDQLVRVETSIYSIAQDKLLWVGMTESLNPKTVDTLIEEVSITVRKELVSEGAIPE